MIINHTTIGDDLQELPANAGTAFPLTNHYNDFRTWASPSVSWHWHRELEFSVVFQGRLEVATPHQRCVLAEGEGCFVNRSILHRVEGVAPNLPVFLTQLVDQSLLGGAEDSVFAHKYMAPVLNCRELELLPFRLSSGSHRKILEHIRTSYEAVDSEAEGYEITARNELSSAWLLLMKELPESAWSGETAQDQTEIRLKKMMLYIQERFADKITLDEIALSASISTRECLRDFQQRLHTTPFRYLIDYRLGVAADLLLTTRRPITDIAADCGFASGSYFTKLFREKFRQTPMEYRKKHAWG